MQFGEGDADGGSGVFADEQGHSDFLAGGGDGDAMFPNDVPSGSPYQSSQEHAVDFLPPGGEEREDAELEQDEDEDEDEDEEREDQVEDRMADDNEGEGEGQPQYTDRMHALHSPPPRSAEEPADIVYGASSSAHNGFAVPSFAGGGGGVGGGDGSSRHADVFVAGSSSPRSPGLVEQQAIANETKKRKRHSRM